MTGRAPLVVSLVLNVALLALGVATWRHAARARAAHGLLLVSAAAAAAEPAPPAAPSNPAGDPPPPEPPPAFHWRQIESSDYRQYLANLRSIGCPERLIRDILVADIEVLYRSRLARRPPHFDPWVGLDGRNAARKASQANRIEALREKRALIRELLGYDWDAEFAEEALAQHEVALLAGFLPDTTLMRLAAVFSDHEDTRRAIEQAAGGILLAEDKAQIRELRDRMADALRQALTPAELEEAQLRAQLADGFPDGLHLEGVLVTAAELRELARESFAYRDVVAEELLERDDVTEEDRDRRRQAFERAVEQRLGPARYQDYQRAQESDFRQIYEFTSGHNMTQSQAIRAHDYWRGALAEAEKLAEDPTLSAADRSTAAAVLRQTATQRLEGLLGTGKAPEFLEAWGARLASRVQEGPREAGEK
ncbi:MAG TPA: hypothetical protein PKM73_00865 [Verrucomicrobiota bacterium]|nr:hypothetical protein [Verrucomicrobiota bacterium]HNU49894.1 hypothetical protein [Verrucomicrobiota bacterium]